MRQFLQLRKIFMRSGDRKSTGRHVKAFLTMVDDDIMVLSLAMMTDAGEENLERVRFLDRKKVPTIDIAHECQRFLERITVLFERQGCLGCGHTAFMLSALAKGQAAIH